MSIWHRNVVFDVLMTLLLRHESAGMCMHNHCRNSLQPLTDGLDLRDVDPCTGACAVEHAMLRTLRVGGLRVCGKVEVVIC